MPDVDVVHIITTLGPSETQGDNTIVVQAQVGERVVMGFDGATSSDDNACLFIGGVGFHTWRPAGPVA